VVATRWATSLTLSVAPAVGSVLASIVQMPSDVGCVVQSVVACPFSVVGQYFLRRIRRSNVVRTSETSLMVVALHALAKRPADGLLVHIVLGTEGPAERLYRKGINKAIGR